MAHKSQDERRSRFLLCFVPLAGALGFSDVFVLAAAAARSCGFVSALLCERRYYFSAPASSFLQPIGLQCCDHGAAWGVPQMLLQQSF